MAGAKPKTPPPVYVPDLPKGWSRFYKSPKNVQAKAVDVLKKGVKYGQGEVHLIDGLVLAFRWEPHWDNHPSLKPGQREDAPDAPAPYWHPGISVWERKDMQAPIPDKLVSYLPAGETPFVLVSAEESVPQTDTSLGARGRTGQQIASSLPNDPKTAADRARRDQAILNLVYEGNYVLRWTPITVDYGDYRATFYVTAEPLMLGASWEDGFYPGVGVGTMQKIADYFNATLLTPKLADEIFQQAAFRVEPHVALSSKMSPTSVSSMLEHSKRIKGQIRDFRQASRGKPVAPLIANIGKAMTVGVATSNREGSKQDPQTVGGQSYGWYGAPGQAPYASATGIPANVWQKPEIVHPFGHADYAHTVMMVARSVELCEPGGFAGLSGAYVCSDGKPCKTPSGQGYVRCVDIYDIAKDLNLVGLVSHEGVVNMRLPDVDWEKSKVCTMLVTSGLSGLGNTTLCGKAPGPAPANIGAGAPSKRGEMAKKALIAAAVLGGAFVVYKVAKR